jgi:hypothetical protein
LCEEHEHKLSGERRALAAKYLKPIDPTRPGDAAKILKVFEAVFTSLEEKAEDEEDRARVGGMGFYGQADDTRRTLQRLVNCLRRDGFDYVAGRIVSAGHVASLSHLAAVAVEADLGYLLRQKGANRGCHRRRSLACYRYSQEDGRDDLQDDPEGAWQANRKGLGPNATPLVHTNGRAARFVARV